MAIATGGKVGIGTVTPAVQLDVLATTAGTHAPLSQFGSTTTTDSYSLKVYNGSGFSEIFAVGNVNNSVQGSAVGDGGMRVATGHSLVFGDSSAVRMTIASNGDVHVVGNLSKGGGSFQIDHPLDPKNKYLYHSFVESPDMKNVYDGNITTNKKGLATVVLPHYSSPEPRLPLSTDRDRRIRPGRRREKDCEQRVRHQDQQAGSRSFMAGNGHPPGSVCQRAPHPGGTGKGRADRGHYLHPDAYLMDGEKPTVAGGNGALATMRKKCLQSVACGRSGRRCRQQAPSIFDRPDSRGRLSPHDVLASASS